MTREAAEKALAAWLTRHMTRRRAPRLARLLRAARSPPIACDAIEGATRQRGYGPPSSSRRAAMTATRKRNRRSRGKRRARAFRAHLADPRHVLDAFKLYAAAMGPRVERGELDADGLFAEFRAILDRLVGEGDPPLAGPEPAG